MAATASARRQSLAGLARTKKSEGSSTNVIRRVAVGIVVLGLLGLVGLWLAGFLTTPKEVLAVRAAVDAQIVELERMARGTVPYSEEASSYRPLMDMARQVPDRYGDQARREIGRFFQARETAEVNSFFAIPPTQRAAELERRIKAEEARSARWEAERAQREASRKDAGSPAGGAASNQANAPTQGQRGRGARTEESRNAWAKRYIDNTSADGRARRTEYRRAKDQKRISMGLEPRR